VRVLCQREQRARWLLGAIATATATRIGGDVASRSRAGSNDTASFGPSWGAGFGERNI
jgi:hypothetical protein